MELGRGDWNADAIELDVLAWTPTEGIVCWVLPWRAAGALSYARGYLRCAGTLDGGQPGPLDSSLLAPSHWPGTPRKLGFGSASHHAGEDAHVAVQPIHSSIRSLVPL
jgi:hypothetical protein